MTLILFIYVLIKHLSIPFSTEIVFALIFPIYF